MIGSRLGDYEIIGKLGAGGMGEVYRGRDARLGRDVALKLVPELYARHPEYLARFEREARILASISHPNVAGIYGVEDAGGRRALVLELVEGATLEELVAGAGGNSRLLPLDRVLDIARQIALGIEAVHERDIVHRDLKPANIKIAPDGTVKVLDFGLGRAEDPFVGGDGNATQTRAVTVAGTVLGTPAYMSPEQARGDAVDRRADIWAFGCVLFEMLTRTRAFGGDSWSETLSRVVAGDVDWSLLPPQTPPSLRRVLRRCLEKDLRRRLRDIGDARLEIEDARTEPSGAEAPARRAGFSHDVRVERLTDTVGVAGSPAMSPDGKMVAFVGVAEGRRHIWIRMIAGGAPLQITRDDADHDAPRWLPDSSAIVYYGSTARGASGVLWQISTLGGTPRRIAPAASGADVSRDGRRLAFFQEKDGGIVLAISGLDGSPQAAHPLSAEFHYDCPRWSLDDREIAFTSAGRLFAGRLEVIAASGAGRRIVARAGWLRGHAWLPDGSGLVYSSSAGSTMPYPPSNNLRVVDAGGAYDRQLTFGDVSYLEPDIRTSGRLLASRVRSRSDVWAFPIDGAPADNVRNAVRITRQTGQIQAPAVSPDGRLLAYISDSGGHSNLWVSNIDGSAPRQITFEHAADVVVAVPHWTPGSDRLVLVRGHDGSLDLCTVGIDDGTCRLLVPEAFAQFCPRDGRAIFFSRADVSMEKIDVATGAISRVRSNATSGAMGGDGTLYFTALAAPAAMRSDNDICRATPDDGPAQSLAKITPARVPMSPRLWVHAMLSPDERWLAAPLLDSTTANLWLIATDGSGMKPVTDFGERSVFMARTVSWSPDGRLYAAVADVDADIAIIEGLVA